MWIFPPDLIIDVIHVVAWVLVLSADSGEELANLIKPLILRFVEFAVTSVDVAKIVEDDQGGLRKLFE